jgi:hypothetical protein
MTTMSKMTPTANRWRPAMAREYPPQVRLGRLYEKTSKSSGKVYLTGRIGLARIVIVKSRDRTDDDTAILDILLSQAPEKPGKSGERAEFDSRITYEPPDEVA